jgi:hypothetical protein
VYWQVTVTAVLTPPLTPHPTLLTHPPEGTHSPLSMLLPSTAALKAIRACSCPPSLTTSLEVVLPAVGARGPAHHAHGHGGQFTRGSSVVCTLLPLKFSMKGP